MQYYIQLNFSEYVNPPIIYNLSFLSIKNEFTYKLIIKMYLGNYTVKDNIILFPDSNMQLLSEIENIPYKHILLVYEKSIDVIFLHESCNVTFDTTTISFSNCKSVRVELHFDYDKIIKMWKDIEILESLFEINIQTENIIIVGKLHIRINYKYNTFEFDNPINNPFIFRILPNIILNIDGLIDFIRLNFPEFIKPLMIKSTIMRIYSHQDNS
jgi:hypothetical protein